MIPTSEELDGALIALNSKIGKRAEWAVDGSESLKLQGMDVKPHDIDILTSKAGAELMASILQEYVENPLEYGETSKYRSHFCVLRIRGVKVEVMGDLQVFREGKWTEIQNTHRTGVRYVPIKGENIPVVPIEFLESTGYVRERVGRERPKR